MLSLHIEFNYLFSISSTQLEMLSYVRTESDPVDIRYR